MQTFVACSTFALAIGLAVVRPRLTARVRIGPAAGTAVGAVLLLASGTIGLSDIMSVAVLMWRPLVTICAMMITTAVAARIGVLERIAEGVFSRRELDARRLFAAVFLVSFTTSSLLNNDAAVLLLTPLVLTLVRRRYPAHPRLLLPFAFSVFMAAGVAPFVVSNPINVIVASYAGLNFNGYAASMVPISLAGSVVTFLLLRRIFGRDLRAAPHAAVSEVLPAGSRLHAVHQRMLVLLVLVLGSYPIVAIIDGSAIWVVSLAGAMAALLLARSADLSPWQTVRRGVSWEVLIVLPAMLVLAVGLRNVGMVDRLVAWYADAGVATIGTTAAVGSALLNNHPMALINTLALDLRPETGPREFLAALIGGDLGPRLLPIGSLAGLIWLESCRRLGVEIALRQFVGIGLAVTIPTLVVSLALLALS